MRIAIAFIVGFSIWAIQAGDDKFALQPAATAPPTELAEAIRKLLPDKSIQVNDAAGQTIGEFWFRAEVPVDAAPMQIKNGLTYREIRQTEILGAVRFDREWSDYRKQKIKPGVYTLRLGFQPKIDDHAGVSEFQEFLLATAAEKDVDADLVEPKEMIERSVKSLGTKHPMVFMLFPNPRPAVMPELAKRPRNHLLLSTRAEATVDGKKSGTFLGLSATIVGHAE